MKTLDRFSENVMRQMAKRTSRRGFLARIGLATTGAAVLPLLPVSRATAASSKRPPVPGDEGLEGPIGDPKACEYWRYCSMDGSLCTHCGGTTSSCPAGTVAGAITWVGTCLNPSDKKEYVISYNDCCGKTSCPSTTAYCNRNQGDMPVYYPPLSNDINWCAGSEANIVYHCSMARVIGVATEKEG